MDEQYICWFIVGREMTEPQRILIIIPNLGLGGAQRVFWEQLHYLSAKHLVRGCVFNWDKASDDERIPTISSLDVPAGRNIISKIYYFFLRAVRLRRLKKQFQIQVAISHLEGADYINILSSRGERTICWIHGSKIHDGNISGFQGMLRKKFLLTSAYRRADSIVAVSKGIEMELTDRFAVDRSRVQTIYNGIDIGKIAKLSGESVSGDFAELTQRPPVFVTHSRLSRQKNLDAMILVFRELRNRMNAKLVIIGDGDERDKLVDLSQHLELKTWQCWTNEQWDVDADVFFIGSQQNPFKYLRRSTFYLMTSNWEGFPLSLCEALACGLPIATTDCFTGPREIIGPDVESLQPVTTAIRAGSGMLLPLVSAMDAKQVSTWVNAVSEAFADKQLMQQYALAGPSRAAQFDITIMHRNIDTLLRR